MAATKTSKQQLLSEIADVRRQLAALEAEASALRALHEHDVHYRDLLDNTHDAVFLFGADNRIFYANQRAAEMFGHTLEELVRMSARDLIVREEYGEADVVRRRTLNGERIPPYERTALHKNGTPFMVEINTAAVRREDGEVRYLYSFVRDVTRRKQAQAEREQLIEELDAFAHTVAHDIKGPLHIMAGFADILLNDEGKLDATEHRAALAAIWRYSLKVSNIVDELLLLAGVRQARDVPRDSLNMRHVLDDVFGRLQPLIDQHQAVLDLPDKWPVAVGYAPWLEEVWTNYLSNAIKYGGHPPHIALGATPEQDGLIRFWVRDDGPGIPPGDQPRLFAPFTRLASMRATGEGLGLSIVQRIVTRLGGTVGVDSDRGQGSSFWFTLPASPPDSPAT